MTNQELQKFLQRFPPSAVVEIRTVQGLAQIENVQMAFDAAPILLKEQNLGWAELLQEKIKAQIVASVIKPEAQ